jgi:23S rRNA (pseudouridine1915-N3)-methyltransferase
MALHIISVGQKMPLWVQRGFDDYAKRLNGAFALKLIEIPLQKRSKNVAIDRCQQQEGQKMLAAIPVHAKVVALDERGHSWRSVQLAEQLHHWQQHSNVAFLIGGPEGLASDCLQRADLRWSLSALTLPHALVRVVLAEQLYRAWSLLNQHPYHRE